MGLVDDHPHKWPLPLQVLEHKQFRLLWLATFVSNSGSWMQRVAAAWLVYTMSGSETWLGIDAALAGLSAEAFVTERLIGQLGVAGVVTGELEKTRSVRPRALAC